MFRLLAMFLVSGFTTGYAAAPFLSGRVTDEFGRPVTGASVSIHDCIGTCFSAATRITDEDGRYEFEKRTFRNMPHLTVSMPGRIHASTMKRGPKLTEEDSDELREADFVLSTPAALTVRIDGDPPEGWSQSVLVRAGRDVPLHRYDVSGSFTQGWATWHFPMLPRDEPLHVVVVRTPNYEPSDDRKVERERRRESQNKAVELIAAELRLPDPQQYTARLNVVEDEQGEAILRFDSVQDVHYTDRASELVTSDPHFQSAVDAAVREKALALLRRVADVATPWNARPPRSISYRYDAVNSKGEKTPVSISGDSPSGPSWNDISRLRGFAYMPPLRWVFNQPENLIIRGFESSDGITVVTYTLKESRRFSAGLGVGPGWNGFFSQAFSSGTIEIDEETDTVMKHRISLGPLGDQTIESFSNYVKTIDGYAPAQMRIDTGGSDFRIQFKIHDDRLWLVDKASVGESDEPVLRIENVQIAERTEQERVPNREEASKEN